MNAPLPLRTSALLTGAGLLFAAGALLGILLPIRAEIEGFPTVLIGLIGSAFAVGHVTGCFLVPRLVSSVGHIRVFSTMAALVAITALINLLFLSPAAWILVRALTGFAFAGATMIIESWLSESATQQTRGRVFARYMMVNLASSVIGHLTIMIYQPGGFEPFIVIALLACLALIPTALSSARAPEPLHEVRLDVRKLLQASPIAVVACFIVGLASGAFGTLAPVYARQIGFPVEFVAFLVIGAVIGGALMQMPLGRLSDRLDRRWVLVGTALSGATLAVVLFLCDVSDPTTVILLVALLGGAMHTLYPVAVAHANDMTTNGDFVSVSSGLLLTFGAGAVIGPVGAAAMMQIGGPSWLFLFIALVYLPLAAYAAWRTRVRASMLVDRQAFVGMETMPASTHQTLQLDPRADDQAHTVECGAARGLASA